MSACNDIVCCSDMSCGTTGAPGGASCVQTETSNRSIGVSANNAQNNNTAALINNLSLLGMSIAAAVTDRPIVRNGNVTTLGNKPLVTGQIQASSVLVVVGLALVTFLVWKGVAK